MVIGNGLIAKAFENYKSNDKFLIFASGVSNSKTSSESDFSRERVLLNEAINKNPEKELVYFSTCSIEDADLKETDYPQHKLSMENLIKKSVKKFIIFRLSNLAGHTSNPHTILNFFYQKIKYGLPFQVWENSERNLIDVEDVYKTCDDILEKNLFLNQVINIANPNNYSAQYIVRAIEDFCHKKANYTKINKGAPLAIDLSLILPVFKSVKIEFPNDYLLSLLKKYYS